MTRKERNKAKADKMRNATGPSTESMNREAAADMEMISDTVAEAKQRGITTAQVLRERRTGKRAPGGGRKPLAANDPTISREITMPESYWTYARLCGDGNASAGIRSALARCCDAHAALAMAEYDGTVTDAHRDAVREAESLHRNSR